MQAMRKMSELKGIAVIDVKDGTKLGQVEEVVVAPDDLRVLGFVVKSGGMLDRKEWIVESEDVRAIGSDAVTVDGREAAHTSEASSERFREAREGNRRLQGRKVVSDTGTLIGTVSEILVDETGKRVAGIEIGGGLLESADSLSADRIVSVGPDVIVARDG